MKFVRTRLLYIVEAEASVADVVGSFDVIRVHHDSERFYSAWNYKIIVMVIKSKSTENAPQDRV